MEDQNKIERVMRLIEIWHYIRSRNIQWPNVLTFIEERINEEIPDVRMR